MNKRILLVLSLQWACSKVPSMESAPTFKQSPELTSKDTTEASLPIMESGTSAFPVFERVDEDTITTKEMPGRLVHEGKVLDSKEPLALENGAIVSSDKRTFVVKSGSPIKLPSLDMKKVAKTIEIQIEVANDLSFALVAGTGEGAESCLALKAKTVLFVDRSEDLAESCWVSLNDWPASLPSVHTTKGLRFSLPVSAFEDLDASFLRVVAKEAPKVAEADTTPTQTPAPASASVPEESKDEPAGIQVVQVAQEQVETLPIMIPDLYEDPTPVPAQIPGVEPESADVPAPAEAETSVADNQPPALENDSSTPEDLPAEPVSAMETDDAVSPAPIPVPTPAVDETVADDDLDEPTQPEASPEAVAFVQEIFDTKKSRYAELKARFDALHKERNEERDQRKKLRNDLHAQKKKMRETCKNEKKADACEHEKNKVSELEKDDNSRTQRIAELKSQINDVKKEAEDEAISLKEVKAKLSSMKGSKQSRAARLAAKQRRLEKKAVLAQMREEKEKEKEIKKQENEAKKAAKEAEKAAKEKAKLEEKAAKEKAQLEEKAKKAIEEEAKKKAEADEKAKKEKEAADAKAKIEKEEAAKKEAEAAAKAKEEAAKKEAEAAAKAKEEAAKKEAEAKANSTKKQDFNLFEKLAEMMSKLL